MGVFLSTLGATITAILVRFVRIWKDVEECSVAFRLIHKKVERNKNGEPKIFPPGRVWIWPFRNSLELVYTGEKSLEISAQEVVFESGTTSSVTWKLAFKVIDPYLAAFEVLDHDARLRDLASGKLNEFATHHKSTNDLIGSEDWTKFNNSVKNLFEEYGAKLIAITIVDVNNSDFTTRLNHIIPEIRARLKGLEEITGRKTECLRDLIISHPGLIPSLIGVLVTTNEQAWRGFETQTTDHPISQDTEEDILQEVA